MNQTAKIAEPGAAPDRKRRGGANRGKFAGRLVSLNVMYQIATSNKQH